MKINQRWKGFLYTFASAACLSITFIASKQALAELSSLAFAPLWFSMASLWGVSHYLLQANKFSTADLKIYWRPLLALGLSSSIANFFFFSAVHLGEPTVVAFFSRSETIFSLSFGIIFLNERLTRWQWVGSLVVVLGAGLMTYQGGSLIWTVLLLAVTANFFHATTSYIAKRNVQNVAPNILGLARTIVLMVTLGTMAGLLGELQLPSLKAFSWIVGGSFFGPFLSYVLYYQGLKFMDMGQAAIIRATQPLFVALYSLLLFGNIISSLQFGGGLILLSGVLLMLSGRAGKPVHSGSNPLLVYPKLPSLSLPDDNKPK